MALQSLRNWLIGALGGNHALSNIGEQLPVPDGRAYEPSSRVTGDSSLQIGAVYSCVKIISEIVGSLPFDLQEESPTGKRIAVNNDLHSIISESPNPEMDSQVFRETVTSQLCLHGNGFVRKARRLGGSREIVALWPLMTPHMRVIRTANNRLSYEYNDGISKKTYTPDQIGHMRLFGNGYIGMSPLGFARNTIGLAQSSEKLSHDWYKSGGKASGYLKVDKLLNDKQRKEIRSNIISPIEATGGTVLLEMGLDYKPLQISPVDLQMIESRRFSVEEICRFFGVPPILVHESSQNTTLGSSVAEIMLAFYKLLIRIYIKRWEFLVKTQILDPAERRRYSARMNFDALLRADSKTRAEIFCMYAQNGVMDRSEIREKENLPRRDGADMLTAQVNLTPLDKLGAGQEQTK